MFPTTHSGFPRKSHPPWLPTKFSHRLTLVTFSPFSPPREPCPWPFSVTCQDLNMPTTLATPCLLQCCFLCLTAFQHSLTEHQLNFCYRLSLGGRRGWQRRGVGVWKMKTWPLVQGSDCLLRLIFFSLASKSQFRCCRLGIAFLYCFLPP